MPVRIAAWSGPRNISTAMMRAWGARPDTAVSDEPLYAHYLRATGADHPGREEVLAAHESDWRRVVEHLLGPIPHGRDIWYQKHMAHHLTPDVERGWVASLSNVLLIRDPAAMIASYARVIASPTPADLGLPQQADLFTWLAERTGSEPPVIDAADVLADPQGMLQAMCAACAVPFDPCMLRWEPGPRPTDGVWAPYWYQNVYRSTGFAPPATDRPQVPSRLSGVLRACERLYRPLWERRLRPLTPA